MRSRSWFPGGRASACSSCFRSGCVWSFVSTGISSESAIRRRLRSISRPTMYSSLRSGTAAPSIRLRLPQLPLPVEHAGLRSRRLRLGHHPGGLVHARERRVREHVLGSELAESLGGRDRLVVTTQVVVDQRQPLPGVGVLRVERDGLPVGGHRLLELVVRDQIDRPVVEILLGGHAASRSESRWRRQAPRVAKSRQESVDRAGPPAYVSRVTDALLLEAELAAAITAVAEGGPPLDFDAWARRIFAHQFERNAPYRTVCERRGVTPAVVARLEDVPAVPTAAFRHLELTCGPPDAVFRTSGTTSGPATRGSHLVPHLELYRASALAAFSRFVLTDGAR